MIHQCFNTEHRLFTPLVGPSMDMDDLLMLHESQEYLDTLFSVIGRLQRINLDIEETVLFGALEMLFTGKS